MQPWSLTSLHPDGQAEQYIDERHRHRYEVNPEMVEELEAGGLRFVGRDETGSRMEILELGSEHGHPFFVGAQFHPEVRECRHSTANDHCVPDTPTSISSLGRTTPPCSESQLLLFQNGFRRTGCIWVDCTEPSYVSAIL